LAGLKRQAVKWIPERQRAYGLACLDLVRVSKPHSWVL
jgi:hypothetical protein